MNGFGPGQAPEEQSDPVESRRLKNTLDFFQRLWLEGLPHGTNLVLVEHGFTRHNVFHDFVSAAAAILAGLFVCFGCAAMPFGLTSRGSATDAAAIPGVWFDLDVIDGQHKEKALPTLDQALSFLYTLPLAPTLIVHSGGGLHVWWLFREAWAFDSDAERDRAQRILDGWQQFVLDAAAARGWRLDNTSPLSGLLRPAGALNTKYDPPREVRLLECNETRWNPSDLEDWPSWESDELGTPPRTPTDVALPKDLPESFRKAIAGLGVGAKERRRSGLLKAVVLETCPYCRGVQATKRGIAHRTAHVAPISGALRCKRQSCDAREVPCGGGVEFRVWVAKLLPADEARIVLALYAREKGRLFDPAHAAELMPDGTRVVDLQVADEGVLLKHIRHCADLSQSKRCIVDCITPTASGKTHVAADVIATRPSAYFANNHALVVEFGEMLDKRGVQYVHIEGVGRACKYKAAFKRYGERRDWRGSACNSCDHRVDGSCGAWKKVPPGAAIIAAHGSYPTVLDMRVIDFNSGRKRSVLEGRLIVLDEGYPSLEHIEIARTRVRVPLDHPDQFGGRAEAAMELSSLFDEVLGRAAQHRASAERGGFPTFIHGERLRENFGKVVGTRNQQSLADSLGALLDPEFVEQWPRPRGVELREERADPRSVPHPDLILLWHTFRQFIEPDPVARAKLVEEHGTLEVVVTDDAAGFELRRRNQIPLRRKAGVLVLDATGYLTREEQRAANPGRRIHYMGLGIRPDPRAKLLSKTILHSSVGRRTMLDGGECTERAIGAVRNNLGLVSGLARDHVGPGQHDAAMLTYKALADGLTSDASLLASVVPAGLRLEKDLIGYYGRDDRGSNRFKGVPVLVTIGDPIPNLGDAEADARALGLDPFDLIRTRTLATLVQAHGRARALRATRPVLLVHVGQAQVPGWEAPGVVLPKLGRPADPARATVHDLVGALVADRRVVCAPLVEAWLGDAEGAGLTAAESAYGEVLVGTFGRCQLPPRRTLNKWLTQAAEAHGAVRFTVHRGRRRMTAWRSPGVAENVAYLEALDAWRRLVPIKGEVIEPAVPAPDPDASDDAAWAEVVEVLGATGRACRACGGDRFWRLSPEHDWVCACCHPPTGPELVEWRTT